MYIGLWACEGAKVKLSEINIYLNEPEDTIKQLPSN